MCIKERSFSGKGFSHSCFCTLATSNRSGFFSYLTATSQNFVGVRVCACVFRVFCVPSIESQCEMYAIPESDFDEGINYAMQQAEAKRVWSTSTNKDQINARLYLDTEQLERTCRCIQFRMRTYCLMIKSLKARL